MTVATRYETIIGIECHVELATRSKMFCGCSAEWFGAPPNTVTCEVCLGLPGALPYPNRRAIELSIAAGIALHCETPEHTKFDRKNYMYPDLPKGYQISQFDLPLSVSGWLEIPADDGSTKRVGIRRAHLEEDTGSLLHAGGATLVDFNRSGVPLLEIVSEPDLRSVGESLAYLEALRERLVYAGVAGFKLEQGGARFDVNVSIRFAEPDGEIRWPPLSEIKNLNSFRALEEAIPYESARLWDEWESGGELRTRAGKITVGWSTEQRRTYLQRTKEEVDDYRYFPEPDLVSLSPDRAMVERIRAALPEMPSDRRARFVTQYGLLGLRRAGARGRSHPRRLVRRGREDGAGAGEARRELGDRRPARPPEGVGPAAGGSQAHAGPARLARRAHRGWHREHHRREDRLR